jgi:hypothetical protein
MAFLAGQRLTAQALNDGISRTLNYTSITANTATNSTATDVAAITTPNITFRNGRAFRIHYTGRWINTAANTEIQLVIRKSTTATAPMLLDSGRAGGDGLNSGTWGFNLKNVVTNTSGADVTVPLLGCFNRVTGTGSVQVAGSPTTPSFLWVEEIGPSSDYANSASLT